jgi:hypothetical protein
MVGCYYWRLSLQPNAIHDGGTGGNCKEAQDLSVPSTSWYADNPMASTVLVICYKYKTLDKRKNWLKYWVKAWCWAKLYENQVGIG